MHVKKELKVAAIALRKQGKTYSEIQRAIPVAKSTLSLWFHEVKLAQHQIQRITQKRIDGQRKGALARRNQRKLDQKTIWEISEKEIDLLSERELWLIGIALYWAEGSKEKEWAPGGRVIFSNSDPRMIRVFLRWIQVFGTTTIHRARIDIYIHENMRGDISNVLAYWSRELNLPTKAFAGVYFKRNKVTTKRKNTGLLYNGLLRVSISRSSILQRKIEGWIRGIDSNCRIV